ncbi:hypothetical protein AAEU28_09105 [Pseudoalteromonas sp. SS15]|uniref:hypothetical protein n=1 Tax=Pseudoalteromonas sp. SS15 TaxID=3139393 RepID=UPI003BAB53EA
MDHLQAHEYLISKPETTVSQPFGEGVDVYKVKGKMFATLALGKMGKGTETTPYWWMNLGRAYL